MAVTSAVHREMEERQGIAMMQQQQQPSMETMMRQGQVVSDLQKRKIAEMEESSEVKRIKINPTETKLQMESIVDEELKRISLGIERQTRAVHLKTTELTDTKVAEFGSELKRTIVNKPALESKPVTPGNVSGSRSVAESQQKRITSSNSASRGKQDQTVEKPHIKSRWDEPRVKSRWDEPETTGKGRKYDGDKRTRHKQSPSRRSPKTPPRGFRSKGSPPRQLPAGRKVWSLRDDQDTSADKDLGRKASAPSQSKNVIVIDEDKSKPNAGAKAAGKSLEAKPGSSGQPTSTPTTTTAVSSMPSFKFSWMSKTVRPLLAKPGVQSGPMPGRKLPAKGTNTYSNSVQYSVRLFMLFLLWQIGTKTMFLYFLSCSHECLS